MKALETTRQCPACRNTFTDDRASAYCVTCQATNDEAFRQAANQAVAAFAAMARQNKDEAAARRIEKMVRT